MGHDYDRAPLVETGEVGHYFALVCGIERVGGFVEEDERWVAVDGAGYEDALFLPLAQTCAVAPDQSVVAQRELHHEVVDAGCAGGLFEALGVDGAVGHGDVTGY